MADLSYFHGVKLVESPDTPSVLRVQQQGVKVFLNVEFEPVGLMEQIHITTHRNILYYQLLLDDVRGAIENGPLSLAA